jgi:serine phosphatase RsbU (regulator of sigma subunit)/anti-sigma regulatory factor (Ser/Thr protein kinase)
MSALPQRARRSFSADARSVADARRFARAQLAEWDAPELQDSAALAVSELVTNVVVHTGTAPVVELRLDAHRLRVEVEDQHPGRALPTGVTTPSDDAEGGRGLMITAALASSWGVEYTPRSKRVWLVCDRDGAPPPGTPLGRLARAVTAHGATVAVVELSADGRVSAWNSDAVRLLGWAADDVLGTPFGELVEPVAGQRPPLGPRDGRPPWQGRYAVASSDGSSVQVFASHTPETGGDGSVVLLVPEHLHALLEHPAVPARGGAGRRAEAPGLPDDALLRLSVDDYLALATERVRDAVDADASYLLLVHDLEDAYEVVAVSGLPEGVRGSLLAPGEPGAPDARSPHLPVVIKDGAGQTVAPLRGTEARALVLVPVVAEGRVIGALATATENHRGFTDEQSALLQRLADSLSLAADRVRLQSSERERRGWLSFVAEAGDLLAASLDQDMTMAITGQIVVPRLATWCAVHLDDERGHPVLQHVWHADERKLEDLRNVLRKTDPDELADSGDAELAGELTTIRLVARGRGIGHLTLGRPAGRPLRDDVRLVTDSIARRAALAIDNAVTHGALLASGRALQNSLLPPSLPAPPNLDVGMVYEAAGEGAAAGGDFYDLFPVDGGLWYFVVGDVCGTGAEAAAVTGLARHTIRALARAGFPVAPMLERLNAAILDEGERSRFLTLVCGTLRPYRGGFALSLVSAGHPQPFVVRPDGAVRQIGVPQSLLGVLDQVEYVAEEHVLERGDLLVALTDGVLERRAGERFLDDDGVAAELATLGALPAQAVAERLRKLVVEFAEEPPQDDMAILALRVEGGPAARP